MRKILLAATMLVGGGLLLSAPAHAVFIDSSNNFFTPTVNSSVTFTFAGKSASDFDLLFNGATTIFNNQTSAIGATFTTNVAANQTFLVQLRNTSSGVVYSPGTANPGGTVHLRSTTTFGDFNIGAAPANAPAGLNGWYGWEDRPIPGGSLTDYNDLVFTINAVATPVPAPEPASMALLGAGLLGLGLVRRRMRG